ncbi:hypothetical protein [Actinoplanes sp. G11-F43]|uniref:hypothetical protein n=1 Tax=Actinoplanes sp. G11-F43 TaxID=3424130 RepID=UPI003D3266BE
MRAFDDPIVRTALPDLPDEFGALLTGPLDPELDAALGAALRRVRDGDHTSEFQSAAPDGPDSAPG